MTPVGELSRLVEERSYQYSSKFILYNLESSAKIAILESTRKTLCLVEPCYAAILLACSV